jgi:hypothetical protein
MQGAGGTHCGVVREVEYFEDLRLVRNTPGGGARYSWRRVRTAAVNDNLG